MPADVNGAFRNVPLHADHVGRFASVIPELGVLVIELARPFGWTLSPMQYWLAGAGITHFYANSKPRWPSQPRSAASNFDAKMWCDDHNTIEPDVGSRLEEADLALRDAMIAVLDPESVNEDKFTTWSTRCKALGLECDTSALFVAMPQDKIEKALGQVDRMLVGSRTTKTQLEKLLGSLPTW